MENKEIIQQIKLYGNILELNGENAFKVRSYQNAAFALEKVDTSLAHLSLKELEKLEGVGKAIAAKIDDANQNGLFRQLKESLEETPSGVIEMLSIDGLGVKKVRSLWKEHGFESITALLDACENNTLAQLKGFGAKTQENIQAALLFKMENSGKLRYPEAETLAQGLKTQLETAFPHTKLEIVGDIRRRMGVVEEIKILIAQQDSEALFDFLNSQEELEETPSHRGVFAWRGLFKSSKMPLEVRICRPEDFIGEVFIHSAHSHHLAYQDAESPLSLLELARAKPYQDEAEIYAEIGLDCPPPEYREGMGEIELAKRKQLPQLIQAQDMKGVLHAHSTYSDGKNTLEEMALASQEAGYEYLGITDHSQSAFYAQGLKEYEVKKQWEEIDRLNEKLAPFKIFKGIESDILNDGQLDYPDEMLAGFDFIIASVHSNLKMDKEKATQRLLRAIENPYTHILGHLTGRILLRREGYPVDYPQIFAACVQHGVSIEINASPYRLDLDWRWVPQALEMGVLLSINPDAHQIKGIQDTQFGLWAARKGGVSAHQVLNTYSRSEFESYLKKQKSKASVSSN